MARADDDLERILRAGGAKMLKAKQGSVQWFLQTVRGLRKQDDPKSKSFTGIATKGPELEGQMIAFSYDPKYKATLPYYDRYPLVIPLSVDSKGMLGLNLHYLPPQIRLVFIRALQKYAVEKNGQKRLQLSYQIVKGAKQLGAALPCIKRYLFGHVKSRFVQVDSREWDRAVLLPLARFVGANEQKVWADSTSGRRPTRQTQK